MPNQPPRFDPQIVARLRERLAAHPVYTLHDRRALQRFMECHVYSVWDFMSLIKYLQSRIAPARWPWHPGHDATVCRFINELVLEEESDLVPGPDGEERCMSHFELYLGAMAELGVDAQRPRRFASLAAREGIEAALASGIAPRPSVEFMRSTFTFIAGDRPHEVAAALAVGREHVIPGMFRALLAHLGVGERDAPLFHFYLKRHIHLDEDFHGPLSLRMLDLLCAGDRDKLREAEEAACRAVEARLRFWDGVGARLERAA